MKNKNLENHEKNPSGDDWETPDWYKQEIIAEFGEYFDPCPLWCDLSVFDGLKSDWGSDRAFCFVNPPYSRPKKELFIHKAIEQASKGRTVAMLLPLTLDTKIYHEVIHPNATEIRAYTPRIKFWGYNTKGIYSTDNGGMSGSMLVIFRPTYKSKLKYTRIK